MTKSKKEGSRKGGRKGEAVKCPHLHFKEDVIDRNVISRQQYLDLLCTPKGYRWQVGDGEPKPFEEVMARGPRKIVCSGRRLRKPERTYVHNFLAEVWALLTPEMVDRLKGMLMNEFGMTPEEAGKFIAEQRETNISKSSTVSLYKKPRKLKDGAVIWDTYIKMRTPNKSFCYKYPKSNVGVRNSWVKNLSDLLSDKMTGYIMDTVGVNRNERQQQIADTLLDRFNSILEQKASMTNPKTAVHKSMVVVADRLSLWLDKNVKMSKKTAETFKALKDELDRREWEEKMAAAAPHDAPKDTLGGGDEIEEEGEEDVDVIEKEEGKKDLDEESVLQEAELDEIRPESVEPTEKPLAEEGEAGFQEDEGEEEADKTAVGDISEQIKPEGEALGEDAPKPSEQEPTDESAAERPAEQGEEAVTTAEEKAPGGEVTADEAEKEKAEQPPEETAEKAPEETPEQAAEKASEETPEEAANTVPEETAAATPEETAETAPAETAETAPAETAETAPEGKKLEEEGVTSPELTEDEGEKPAIEETPVGSDEEKVEPESTVQEEAVRDKEPSSEPTSDTQKDLVDIVDQEEVPKEPSEPQALDEQKEPSKDKEVKVEEPTRKKSSVHDGVISTIASAVEGTKVIPSRRQESIKDVLEKHLEKTIKDKDPEVVSEVTGKLSTWMDQTVQEAEEQAKLSVDSRKSPIFKVKQIPNASEYEVEPISPSVASKCAKAARGLGDLEPVNTKRWAEWATSVTDVAQHWAKWIENTVDEAQSRGRQYKENVDLNDWREFKETKGKEALEWRRQNKQLTKQAETWDRLEAHRKK